MSAKFRTFKKEKSTVSHFLKCPTCNSEYIELQSCDESEDLGYFNCLFCRSHFQGGLAEYRKGLSPVSHSLTCPNCNSGYIELELCNEREGLGYFQCLICRSYFQGRLAEYRNDEKC